MDDAARTLAERIMREVYGRDDNAMDGVTSLIAAALRDVEADSAARASRLAIQYSDVIRERDALATRLARVEAALAPTAIWTVNGKDRLLHAIDGDGLSHGDLARIVTNVLRALTPDAMTEGT